MEPDSPQRKENENPDENAAKNQKEKSSMGKNARIAAIFGIIEVLSLVLDEKADDFSEPARYYIHWLSECGFLAGGAYVAHEIFKTSFWRTICWLVWGVVCIVLLLSKSPPETDESGNPIGFLSPANDPMPDVSWAPSNSCFMIFGGNISATLPNSIIPAIRFHKTDILLIGSNDKGAFASGSFFDKKGELVAILETNEWTLNRLHYFRKFIGKNTLIVSDEENNEMLNVRFCNPKTFQITGTIRFPDSSDTVVIKTNYFEYNGSINTGMRYYANISYSAGGFGIRDDGSVEWGIGVPQAR